MNTNVQENVIVRDTDVLTVLEKSHEDYSNMDKSVVLKLVEKALMNAGYVMEDFKVETIDVDESVEDEIVSGDAVLSVEESSQSRDVQYEILTGDSVGYSSVVVGILLKDNL